MVSDLVFFTLISYCSRDPERMARFEREAKLLASLNHPNIATIYGLEEAQGKRFLVLEIVEGETLAQRIGKGPLPVDEALEVCRQIAEGLEAAHEKGIIHRDLKPANVKITLEGKVKVLDFGLAKAFQGETPATDASKSPTLTEQMTRPGVILGAAAYMAPEQAKGEAVDMRADIWAFGCILYECLSGKHPFPGETVAEIVAAIIKGEPGWEVLPLTTPLLVQRLLRRCMQKEPRERMRDIADARLEIEEALKEGGNPVAVAGYRPRRLQTGLTLAATLLLATIAGIMLWRILLPGHPAPAYRVAIPLSAYGLTLNVRGIASGGLAISPDGQMVVFTALGSNEPRLYMRRIGEEWEPRELKGTEQRCAPFFSPDGEWVAYSTRTGMFKIPVRGGQPQLICTGQDIYGGAWGVPCQNSITAKLALGGLRIISLS